MPNRKPSDIIYPTTLNVERFHEIVISQRGSSGYNSLGLVGVGIEWAKNNITYEVPNPGLLLRAGAMMFAYVNFHAWADGNKRTALMSTAFFFFLNQYGFNITLDSPDFTVEIAESWIKNNTNPPIVEIRKIADWLRPRVALPGLSYAVNRFSMRNTKLDDKSWEIFLEPWIDITSEQIKAIGKKNNKHHHHKSDDS